MNIAGLPWKPWFSPHKYIRQVPYDQIYDGVRYVMWRWGRIHWLRVDNGSPFGDPTRQAVSILHLCLAAHGIRLKVNPPRTPTRNAKVERNQGTTARWAEPDKCKDYLELQQRLNEAVREQRECYPTRVCGGKTRAQTYPELLNNPIRFKVEDFELRRVYRLLARGEWKRLVSDRGSVDLFWETYQLGHKHRGRKVLAKLNYQSLNWEFLCSKGQIIKVLPMKTMTKTQLKSGIKYRYKQKG